MEEGPGLISSLFSILVVVAVIAGMWKTFVKAGQPGWACLIPIYNVVVIIRIAGKPIWWILLLLVPLVNFVVHVVVGVGVAEKFGKGVLFGVGIAFLPMIFYPMLGFGDASYKG